MITAIGGAGAKVIRKNKAQKVKSKAQKKAAAGTGGTLIQTGVSLASGMMSGGGGRRMVRKQGGRRRGRKTIPMRVIMNWMMMKNTLGSGAMNKMSPILALKMMKYIG